MVTTSETGAAGAVRGAFTPASVWALVAAAALAGCFRDRGAGVLCVGDECAVGTSGMSGTSGTSTGVSTQAPTTTDAPDTTGAPVDSTITLRITTMAFVDPHLFLTEEAMDSDTDDVGPSCASDVTVGLNGLLSGDIEKGKFNLLMQFADFGGLPEVRLLKADCDPIDGSGSWKCTPSAGSPKVTLDTEVIAGAGCRDLEPGVYQDVNVPLINDPAGPCLRTKRSFLALPVSDAVGSLDLRDAQMIGTLDSATAPTRLQSGVVYGFLPMAAAENLELDAPLFGVLNLWSVIEAPPCDAKYPELLPSVDMFPINGMDEPGVWIAINYTAEQVEFSATP